MKNLVDYFNKKPKRETKTRERFKLAYAWHKNVKQGTSSLLFCCASETLALIGFKDGDRVNISLSEDESFGVFSLSRDGAFKLSQNKLIYRAHIGMRSSLEQLVHLFPDIGTRAILEPLEISIKSRSITFKMPETFKLSAETK